MPNKDNQTKVSQTEEVQAKASQAAESQTDAATTKLSQAAESQADAASTKVSQAAESQADAASTKSSQAAESHAKESQAKGKMKKKSEIQKLAICAMLVALGTVASFIKLFSFPTGGSITFFSMLFICLAGYFYGPTTGVITAVVYGLLQFAIEPYVLFPLQVVVDYVLAFGVMGLSGLVCNKKHGLIKGYIIAVIGRYIFAVLSGWIFFGEYAWDGWNPLPYSLAYNAIYIFAEAAVTVIILCIPAVSGVFERTKKSLS